MRISKLQRALVAVALVSSTISLSGLATDAQAKTRKPTVQEIAAAKAAEQAKAQAAAAAKAKLDKGECANLGLMSHIGRVPNGSESGHQGSCEK